MSIKKLFDSADGPTRNTEDYKNQKDKYEFVESADNAKQIINKNTSVPASADEHFCLSQSFGSSNCVTPVVTIVKGRHDVGDIEEATESPECS